MTRTWFHLQDDERRIASVIARKEEEKRRENNKIQIMKVTGSVNQKGCLRLVGDVLSVLHSSFFLLLERADQRFSLRLVVFSPES